MTHTTDMLRDEPFAIGPVSETSDAKVVDVYKMYADRAAAIRTMMIVLVPIATTTLSAVIALRTDLQKPFIVTILGTLVIFVLVMGSILRLSLNRLLDDYEAQITIEQVRTYKLLPLDSFQRARDYQAGDKVEEGRAITFANVVSLSSAIASCVVLFALVLFSE